MRGLVVTVMEFDGILFSHFIQTSPILTSDHSTNVEYVVCIVVYYA